MKRRRNRAMLSVHKRPFGAPHAVVYSYELSKLFLDENITSILEVGCGIGVFAFRYASQRRDALVVGVDRSAKTIEFLSSNYGKYYKNLQLKTCDFCENDVSLGDTFDAVYSSDVLEHVANTQSFVNNIYRHLRAGGRAVVNFPNQTSHGINHYNDVEDLRRLFATFGDVRVYEVDIKHLVFGLWLKVRGFYERFFSPSTKDARDHLNSGREQLGIDCFEDSTCFNFVNDGGRFRNLMASILAESLLLANPAFEVREVERGSILNSPRLVVVATR